MEENSSTSSNPTYLKEMYNTLHLSNGNRYVEVLVRRMKEQMDRDITHIGKTMHTSLIKGRIRRDSNKIYNWYNERIRVGSQIYKVFHMPDLVQESIFKDSSIQLSKEREIYHQTKTRTFIHIASVARFVSLFSIGNNHLGAVNTEDY